MVNQNNSRKIYTSKQEAAMQSNSAPENCRNQNTAGLGSIGGSDVRATEIHSVLCEFDYELQSLRSIAQTLYDRLEPIMHSSTPREQEIQINGSSVPLVNRVRDFRQVVRSTSELLQEAIERIEL